MLPQDRHIPNQGWMCNGCCHNIGKGDGDGDGQMVMVMVMVMVIMMADSYPSSGHIPESLALS